MDDLQVKFRRDGVVVIRKALDSSAIALVEAAFYWSLNNPGPGARNVLGGAPGAFYQDHANPASFRIYRRLLCDTPIPYLVAGLLASKSLWLLYEQIWLKEGGNKKRTPWHQDLPYIPLEGYDLAVLWTNLDVVAEGSSLEFVCGSHRGPLFNPTAFDANDESAAMFEKGTWPALPDIEATRNQWPIVSWPMEPGDVVIFHPAILHGGAPTIAGQRRRTLSLRFFGEHAYCASRPDHGLAEIDRIAYDDGSGHPLRRMAQAIPGTLFRHPGFPKLL